MQFTVKYIILTVLYKPWSHVNQFPEFSKAGIISDDDVLEDACCKLDILGTDPMSSLDVDGRQVSCCRLEISGPTPLPTIETLFSLTLFEAL